MHCFELAVALYLVVDFDYLAVDFDYLAVVVDYLVVDFDCLDLPVVDWMALYSNYSHYLQLAISIVVAVVAGEDLIMSGYFVVDFVAVRRHHFYSIVTVNFLYCTYYWHYFVVVHARTCDHPRIQINDDYFVMEDEQRLSIIISLLI
jgi:hypothetical protein